jgi:hypothetical protein
MKKIVTLITLLAVTLGLTAQSPEQISYQAVVRDAGNNLVTSQTVGVQISILQGSANGSAVYVETHTPQSNDNGLVTFQVGNGTVVFGDFSTINWANGPYFIKTETDPAGGTSYSITGTSQLLSVPYAFHAKTADSVTGGIKEKDPVYSSSQAANITATDISNLSNLSGTNTGDQDLSSLATKTALGDSTAQVRSEIPDVPSGTQTGEMQYWDGSQWVTVAAGNEGQVLTFTGGAPTWTTPLEEGDVQNPATGEIWMDKNLGASQVATSSTDANAYGDLYQWGRAADGHESRTSGITSTLATSDTPGHGDFITTGTTPYDWRSPQNDNLWQGVNGTSNPCPNGYRLPTKAEWEAERTSWNSDDAAGAFGSPLKLPVAGLRINDGSIKNEGSQGFYWSSTVDGTRSWDMYYGSIGAGWSQSGRVVGRSVRCLKD